MDELEWGNHRGSYVQLKHDWIDPPQGTSRNDLRKRFKTLLTLIRDANSTLPTPSSEKLKTTQKEIKEKIIRGTDLAIQYLEGKLKEGPTKTNLSLIKAEWQAYRREEMLGLLDFNQKQLKSNTLRVSVMTFIDGLSEEDLL